MSDEDTADCHHAGDRLGGVGWSDNDFDGRLWHAAGRNTDGTTRRALICEHVLPWLRPADTHILATGVDQLRSLAPDLRRLAGVAPASDYLGLVAGQEPERWLQQTSAH